jgi:hypothetical protein
VKTRYETRRKRDATECFRAVITTVFMGLDTKRALPLADEPRAVFKSYLSSGA